MKKHESVTRGLLEIGACWATSTQRYICADHNCCQRFNQVQRPLYHVNPDASRPEQLAIRCFHNLDEIAAYIKAIQECRADPERAFEIMDRYEESRAI